MAPTLERTGGGCFLAIFALFFGGMVAVFDGMLVLQWWQERAARAHWDEVPATVIESRVETSSSDEGTSYSPLVRYEYTANGERRESDRHSFGAGFHFGRSFADEVVERYPTGARVTAWVDPSDPDAAVLSVDGSSLPRFVLLFLTPFHCVPLTIAAALFIGRRRRRDPRGELEQRLLRVDTESDLVIAKRPPHPALVFPIALGALAFVSVFVLGFGFGFDRAERLALPVLFFLVVAAVIITRLIRQRAKRPSRYLHVDLDRRTFAFPADGPHEPLPHDPRFSVDSERTNTMVDGVPIHEHTLEVSSESGEARPLFQFRGPREEGEALLDLIARRLLGVR